VSICAAAGISVSFAGASHAQPLITDANQAKNYTGKAVTVCGESHRPASSDVQPGRNVLLRVEEFDIVVAGPAIPRFAQFLRKYRGGSFCATGIVDVWNDHPQIVLFAEENLWKEPLWHYLKRAIAEQPGEALADTLIVVTILYMMMRLWRETRTPRSIFTEPEAKRTALDRIDDIALRVVTDGVDDARERKRGKG
jgi:hypothetical protein